MGLLLSSCSTLKNVEKMRVNNRQVEYVTAGTGSPTIVLESGMGQTIDTWVSIFDSLTSLSSVYTYNRPGYGQSGINNPPKTIVELAQQLHENLKATGQGPPYLLIGHSAGGLYVNMFARLYPEEVAGVIYLDASHPDQFEYFRTGQPLLYNMLITATQKGNKKYEFSIVKNTQSDFKNAPPFPDIPLSVLTAGKKSSPLENDKMRKKWLEFQNELAALSKNSNHLIVNGSGHYVHKDKPAIVLHEVKRIIANPLAGK